MKRIDDLVGATVQNIYVTSSGTLRIYFKPVDGRYATEDWTPMVVKIPPEPKKRTRKK